MDRDLLRPFPVQHQGLLGSRTAIPGKERSGKVGVATTRLAARLSEGRYMEEQDQRPLYVGEFGALQTADMNDVADIVDTEGREAGI
jgi:hypothetical protein